MRGGLLERDKDGLTVGPWRISPTPRDPAVPQCRSAMNAVCSKAPSKSSGSPSPWGGNGVQTSKSHAILIQTCITKSRHKIQKIKLKKRNWLTSKSTLIQMACTHTGASLAVPTQPVFGHSSPKTAHFPQYCLSQSNTFASMTVSFWQGNTYDGK